MINHDFLHSKNIWSFILVHLHSFLNCSAEQFLTAHIIAMLKSVLIFFDLSPSIIYFVIILLLECSFAVWSRLNQVQTIPEVDFLLLFEAFAYPLFKSKLKNLSFYFLMLLMKWYFQYAPTKKLFDLWLPPLTPNHPCWRPRIPLSVTIGHAIFIFTHHACIESVFCFSENSDCFDLKQALWSVKRLKFCPYTGLCHLQVQKKCLYSTLVGFIDQFQ